MFRLTESWHVTQHTHAENGDNHDRASGDAGGDVQARGEGLLRFDERAGRELIGDGGGGAEAVGESSDLVTGEAIGSGQLRSELIALRVGEDDPTDIVALADVDVSGPQVEQATDLLVPTPVGGTEVEVEPVFDGLALGYAQERRHRWHRAGTFLTFVDPGRTDGDGIVVLVPDRSVPRLNFR